MKRKLFLCVALLVLFMAGGCSSDFMTSIYNDDSRIVEESDSYNRVRYVQNIRNNKCKISAGKMEGMSTLWSCRASRDMEADIIYKIQVEKGKVKLVLIAPDDTLTTVTEVTSDTSEEHSEAVLELKEGMNRIKIVAGEDTKFKMEMSVSEGEFKGGD